MQRTIVRTGLVIVTGLALFALAAAPALATTVSTEPASEVRTTSAVLNGVIATGGAATTWQFQWGTTPRYGGSTPPQQIPTGKGTVRVSWRLEDLRPNTTYHFRLVAISATSGG